MSADTKAWNEYWRGAEGSAQAMTGIRAGKALEAHWAAVFESAFASARPDARILDMACGTGDLGRRALQSAAAAGVSEARLICADSAPDAMKAAAAFPRWFVVCDALRPPFADASFDLAVSQFGLEYAGRDAAPALARLVAPGGLLACILHLAGGGIDMECRRNIAALDIEARADVLARLRRFFSGPAPQKKEEQALRSAAAEAVSAARALPAGGGSDFVRQLTDACRTLFENRDRYYPHDALGWIDHQVEAVRAYRLRMESMVAAAIDEAGMKAIVQALEALGFSIIAAEHRELVEGKGAAAWDLRARRSA